MRQNRQNEIIVGLFVITALAVLFVMTFLIRGNTGMKPYLITTDFPNVSGLEKSSPVLVSGFRLGRVVTMRPGKKEDGTPTVIVHVRIARTIPIYKNATVDLVQQGFIGDKQLEIDPGTADSGEIENGDHLIGVPPETMGEVYEEARKVMAELQETLVAIREFATDQERLDKIDRTINNIHESTERFDTILADNEKSIKEIVRNVNEASRNTRDVAEKLDELMENVEEKISDVGDEAQGAIQDIRKSTQKIADRADKILDQTNGISDNANELLVTSRQEVQELSTSLQQTSDSLNKIFDRLNAGEGTIGQLLNDTQPLEEFRESLNSLKGFLYESGDPFFSETDIEYNMSHTKESDSSKE
jgi:phospholipid/cholesterol/gamma-HCH transport system substrate-binding protein